MGSFLSGAICRKSNNTALLLTVAAVSQLLGISLMLVLSSAESSFVPAYGFTLIFGLGTGLVFGAATILSAVETDSSRDHAVAQGAIAQARALGGSLGVAICTALFNHRLGALTQHLSQQQLVTLYRTPTASSQWPDNLLRLIKEVYATSFKDQTLFMIGVCSVMVVAALFTWEKSPKPITCLGTHAQQANKTSLQQGEHGNNGTEMSDMGSIRSV